MIYRIIYFLFKKYIDRLVEEKFTEDALNKYIDEHFSLVNGLTSPELQFRGKRMIKYMAASLYEIVKDADNYVTMDLTAVDYEPMTVTIQKKWKLSPHDRAEKLKKENEELKAELEKLRNEKRIVLDLPSPFTIVEDETSEAGICRKNGWVVGDCLEGTEVWGDGTKHTDVIQITALGEKKVLARWRKDDQWQEELLWTLRYRDWQRKFVNIFSEL